MSSPAALSLNTYLCLGSLGFVLPYTGSGFPRWADENRRVEICGISLLLWCAASELLFYQRHKLLEQVLVLLSFRSRGSSDGGSDCLLSQLHGLVAAGYIKWMQSFLYVRTAISTTISSI